MDYLILKIIVCLALAFLLGLVIGWLIRHLSCSQQQHHLSGELLAHKQSLRQLEKDADYSRREAGANQQRVEELQEQLGALKEKLNASQHTGSQGTQGGPGATASDAARIHDLVNDLNLARADRDHLNLKLHDRQREVSRLNSEMQALRDELGKLGGAIASGSNTSGSAFALSGSSVGVADAKPKSTPAPTSTVLDSKPSESASDNAATLVADLKLDPETLKSSYKVEEIAGIGKGYGKRLRAIGVATTTQMQEHGSNEAGLAEIAKATRVEQAEALAWVRMAELLRLPGVRGQFAGLLYKAGIDSPTTLAQQSPKALTESLIETNAREHCASLQPSEAEVAYWIAAAGELSTLKT